MFKVIVDLAIVYLLYKLIFDFIIPVYQTTKQVKQKVGEMQTKMQEHLKKQEQQANKYAASPQHQDIKSVKEDYIDFEEVK